jgi:hypothetical protein
VAEKIGLVIANTEYQDASFAKLTAPGKDAEEFASVLQDQGLAAFDDVQVLLNEEERKIRRAIARFFADRKRDDLLLLYFSGHGVRNEQGQLFLTATDTEISILEATGIPADFITNAMNSSRSQRQLLILDCCNSGAFAHGSKSVSAIGKSMGIAAAFEGSGFGRVVLTATDATQYAWEGDEIIGNTQKSVFTHFLIEGLKGEADRDGDGRIHVDELYDYAYEQIVQRTPKQTPGKWSYKQQGDLILRENLKPRDVKPAPLPSELLYYLDHPSSGVRSTGVEELIRLLDGKHLGLARAAGNKLLEIATNDDSLTLRRIASETLTARGKTIEPPAETQTEIPLVAKPAVDSVKSEQRIQEPVAPERVARKISLSKRDQRQLMWILGSVLVVLVVGWLGIVLSNEWPSLVSQPTPTATDTPRPTNTNAPTPSETFSPTPLGLVDYIIQENDSVESVAQKLDLGEDGPLLIYYANQDAFRRNGGVLFVGQILRIPPPGSVLPSLTPLPTLLQRGSTIEYAVLPGDTIRDIAHRFRSLEGDIIEANEMSGGELLQVGQILKIPVNLVTATATMPSLTPSRTPTSEFVPVEEFTPFITSTSP